MFSARDKYPNFRRAQRTPGPYRKSSHNAPAKRECERLWRPSFALVTLLFAASVFGLVYYFPFPEAIRPRVASLPAPAPAGAFTCTVTGVHDGDGPIYCAEGPKIRLHAIAARELDETCLPGHPCPGASGAAAKRALEALALGQRLTCEATGTSYGRVTAICRTSAGTELNCAMVRGGYAIRWNKFDRQRAICG
ncbi:MAG TPA: hypothetical protein PKA57_03535 [Parvibaculum sp.]|uniref:thermonuclease family protein n=1 Tax=Parvibaculum sp. TaxID=2024848 RepID=UPI002B914C49|nr:hypothetical protein [Parvibaculum sp.]HMM13673.1 hypothetical protein [Parvibaculum sp.]